MLTVKKGDRHIHAMVMNKPVDRCLGVVQCALEGCQAYMAVIEQGARRNNGDVEDATSTDQVKWFLEHHECRANVGSKS